MPQGQYTTADLAPQPPVNYRDVATTSAPGTLSAKIAEARSHSYSDADILGYLSKSRSDLAPKIAQAQQHGYSAGDIIGYLGGNARPQMGQYTAADIAPPASNRSAIAQARQAGYSDAEISDYLRSQGVPMPAPISDPLESALNYRTGDKLIDAPLGVLQGVGKGLMSTVTGINELANKTGSGAQLDPAYVQSLTQPNGIGQGTGKFLEQAAEFAVPDAAVGDALKGAGLIARLGARGATAASVAGAQTGGNPEAMATAGLLGAGAEGVGATLKTAGELTGKLTQKAPTAENYAKAFAATPGQKPIIGNAVETLKRDGIQPTDSPAEMQAAIKNQLTQLGQRYQALDPKIANRTIDADRVIADLKQQQAAYTHGAQTATKEVPAGLVDERGHPITRTETASQPFVSNANRAYHQALQNEINDVQTLAKAHGGKLTFSDLQYLRDGSNGRVNFASPSEEWNLYRGVGNAYRRAMDQIAPETTRLNRDYARYKTLESIADKNVSMGRGTTPSAFEQALSHHTGREVGAAVGAGIGHLTGLPGASWLGAGIGAVAWPKLTEPVFQALKNAADNGAFAKMPKIKLDFLRKALTIGDNKAALKVLDSLPLGATQATMQRAVTQ